MNLDSALPLKDLEKMHSKDKKVRDSVPEERQNELNRKMMYVAICIIFQLSSCHNICHSHRQINSLKTDTKI